MYRREGKIQYKIVYYKTELVIFSFDSWVGIRLEYLQIDQVLWGKTKLKPSFPTNFNRNLLFFVIQVIQAEHTHTQAL